MNTWTTVRKLFCVCSLIISGCATVSQPQSCPPGLLALQGTGEDKVDGTASAKIETPDGGIRLDAVDEKLIPLKATAEVKGSISRSMRTACLNENILKAIAANPDKWVFKMKSDGYYELSAK